MFIVRLCKELESRGAQYAVAGGYAVALHGVVRGTIDVDIVLVLEKENLKICEDVLKSLGLRSTLPLNSDDIFNNRETYINERNLIAWNFHNPDKMSEIVDIIITTDLSQVNYLTIEAFEQNIKVLDIPSIIQMKTISGRPQDIEDIKALQKLL